MKGRTQDAPLALLVFVEPTPYRMGLIRRIAERSPLVPEVVFIGADVSQSWRQSLSGVSASFLPAGTLASAVVIARKLWTRRYRLVHLAGWGGHGVLLCTWMLALWHRLPLFVESDTQLPVVLAPWKRAIKRLVYPALFRTPRKFFAGGTRQVAYFHHYGVPGDRIVIDGLTVDVTEIIDRSECLKKGGAASAIRASFGLTVAQTVFIFVGRLERYKGIEDLLKAFDALNSNHPETALLVVGDGSERSRVVAAAGSNASIRYLGRLDYERVIQAYNCADVAVVPSLNEPWGLVVNEAMAVGLPVIASDRVGCVDDLVRHGKTGLIYDAGSVEDLGQSMLNLLQAPQKRSAMGLAGRRLISGWTLELQAQKIVAAWDL